jgi:F-type H+-transporting ATPase subunit delta
MAKLVSRTYSSALFEVAVEMDKIDQILAEYEFVANSLDEYPDFESILTSPKVSDVDKKKIIDETYGSNISPELSNFFKLLVDKKRSSIIKEAFGDFKILVNNHKGLVVAKVESVIPLESKDIEALEAKLNELTGQTVTVNNVINPDIMGGLVVKVGDKIIDGSVKRKLDGLKHDLAQIII